MQFSTIVALSLFSLVSLMMDFVDESECSSNKAMQQFNVLSARREKGVSGRSEERRVLRSWTWHRNHTLPSTSPIRLSPSIACRWHWPSKTACVSVTKAPLLLGQNLTKHRLSEIGPLLCLRTRARLTNLPLVYKQFQSVLCATFSSLPRTSLESEIFSLR